MAVHSELVITNLPTVYLFIFSSPESHRCSRSSWKSCRKIAYLG